jgi:NAD(P)H-dependent FMN reductase
MTFVVISGSARQDRVGPAVARWVCRDLRTMSGARLDLIDAGQALIPDYADLRPGAQRDDELSARIAAADGYVVVTPEYNHGYPASLKQIIDSYYHEWMFKPAMLVCYGVSGGALAAEQLRCVFSELHVVTTRKAVTVSSPWGRVTDDTLVATGGERDSLGIACTELQWWASALRGPREQQPYQAR